MCVCLFVFCLTACFSVFVYLRCLFCECVCLSVYLSVCLCFVCLTACLSVCLPVCLSLYVSSACFANVSVCLSVLVCLCFLSVCVKKFYILISKIPSKCKRVFLNFFLDPSGSTSTGLESLSIESSKDDDEEEDGWADDGDWGSLEVETKPEPTYKERSPSPEKFKKQVTINFNRNMTKQTRLWVPMSD